MIHLLSIALVVALVSGILAWKMTGKKRQVEKFCPYSTVVPTYVPKIQTKDLPSTEDLMLTAANTQSSKYPSKPFWPDACIKPMSKVSTQVYMDKTRSLPELGVTPVTMVCGL